MRLPTIQRALLLAGALCACVGAIPVAAAASANLIVNGSAETGKCASEWTNATTVPGWTITQGNPSVVCYSVASIGTPSASEQGAAFLANGPYGDSSASQTINVASAASTIDAGGVSYNLSGWLGGYTVYAGQASVVISFLDAQGRQLGGGQIGPVSPSGRGLLTKLISQSSSGAVPSGTRLISVLLQFNKTNGTVNVGYADNLSLTLSTPLAAPTLQVPASNVPAFDHVFFVFMENTDYSTVVGNTSYAPYINSLIKQGALLSNYNAVYHPSDENYMAVVGGDTYTKGATYYPNINNPNRHIGDLLEAAGKSWKSYEQGMGTPCNMTNSADTHFHADDAPFANYTNISGNLARCQAHLVDLSQLGIDLSTPATTPAFAWIAANNYNNGEDAYYNNGMNMNTSMLAQDQWLQQTLPALFNSPAWKQQRSLLILSWDESMTGSWVSGTYNQVATVVLGSPGLVKAGYQSALNYNHYSSARTIESALGIGGLTANDSYAQPFNDVFTASPSIVASLSTTNARLAQGSTASFSFVTPYANFSSKNWVGIYPVGTAPGSASAKTWQYTSGAAGSVNLSTAMLGAGNYVAVYLYNDGFQQLAAPVPFTVY